MANILIVDDDATFVHLLTNLIASFGDTPLTATQGTQVFNIIEEEEIDLLLLDIFMPILSGIEILKKIKNKSEYKHIPVIMITGSTKASLMTECFEAGASDFITKPISPIVLQARLSTILGKQKDIKRLEKEIRDRKNAESSLRKLSVALEQSPGMFFLTDPIGNIEYANLRCFERTGFQLEEILGRKPVIFQSGEIKGVTYDNIWNIISKGGTWEGNLCNRKKNGELFWVHCSISPVFTDQGRLSNFLIVQEDISDKLKAEKELNQKTESLRISERRLRTIIEATHDGIVVIGKNKEIQFVNPAAEKLLGSYAKELLGEKFWYPLTLNQLTEIIIQRPNDKDIIAEYRVIETETDEGKVWVASFKKIKDNDEPNNNNDKKLKQQFKPSEQKCQNTPTDIVDAESATPKSDFIANISHEFRTPMHAILSFANFGIKKTGHVPDEKIIHYFEQIKNSANRLMPLVDNLIELSSLEAGIIECHMLEHDIFPIIMVVVQEQEKIAEKKQINFQVSHSEAQAKAKLSKSCIIKVVRHILQNAIRFSKEQSTITISIDCYYENNHPFQKISFSDNGMGIPEQELKDIFLKFFQSSKTKTTAGGTGIGLAICKHIIEKHGGKIWAENNPDQGATIAFTLPVS